MKQRPEPFAEMLARARAAPMRPKTARLGRHGNRWGDHRGESYALVNADLSPEGALALAANRARVVYDACGCGGAECTLDWLSAEDVSALASQAVLPIKRERKNGRADLEHWRSDAGRDLLVAAVDVSWGDRILGW